MQARYLHLENIAPDAIEKVEITPGVPMIYRFNGAMEVIGREWLE
jgi:bisphosphoglycerate-dependent phosphoglycerate mutase